MMFAEQRNLQIRREKLFIEKELANDNDGFKTSADSMNEVSKQLEKGSVPDLTLRFG
jgi:hypothetical protein